MKKIKLTQNKVALVDDEDFKIVSQYRWYAQKISNTYYACVDNRAINKIYLYMHRLIMEKILQKTLLKEEQVDHKNHNGLDNRRQNIRICYRSCNNANRVKQKEYANKKTTSKYKGVSFNKKLNKWEVYITINKKKIGLGYFEDEKAAATIYNKAALKYFSEFAYLNKV